MFQQDTKYKIENIAEAHKKTKGKEPNTLRKSKSDLIKTLAFLTWHLYFYMELIKKIICDC